MRGSFVTVAKVCRRPDYDLPRSVVRAEIDGRPNRSRAHVVCILYRPEKDFFKLIGVREQFVVVDLDEERNLVCVFSRNGAKNAEGGCYGITTPFDGKLHNVLWIEIERILCEARPGRMLDTLIDGKDGHVAGARQPSRLIHAIQVVQDALV